MCTIRDECNLDCRIVRRSIIHQIEVRLTDGDDAGWANVLRVKPPSSFPLTDKPPLGKEKRNNIRKISVPLALLQIHLWPSTFTLLIDLFQKTLKKIRVRVGRKFGVEQFEFGCYQVCYKGNTIHVGMDGLIWYKSSRVKGGSKGFRLEPLDTNYVWGLCWPPQFYCVSHCREEDRSESLDLLPRKALRINNFLFRSVRFSLVWGFLVSLRAK